MNHKFLAAGIFFVLMLTICFTSFGLSASAAGFVPDGSGQAKCTPPASYTGNAAAYCGDYAINDFVVMAVLVAKWILGIVGSLTLLMFVYGGIMFMISAGSSDKITQAKKIIVSALVGLLIVFSSWMIINFATTAIGAKQVFDGDISGTNTATSTNN